MSQETPSQIETQKDQVLPAKKEVKPLDEAAQKENADKRKIQEFASQIAEDPKIFLEKIQKDPKFASENKQLIVQAVMQIHKLIFEDRDQITNRLWNDGITGKGYAVMGNLLQGVQDLSGGGRLAPTNAILDALEKIK